MSDTELHEPLLGGAAGMDASAVEPRRSRRRSPSPSHPAKPMAAVERLVLSPYEKWIAHGRFPFKLALHVLLLALTSVQLGVYGVQNAAYMRATHRNWCLSLLCMRSSVWRRSLTLRRCC